jgi:gliding motility-associated-like protein
LISGNYTLVVTDNFNCSRTTSITISQPTSALTLASSITNVSCFAGNDGAIDITPSGGNGSYQYLWSNGSTSQNLQNLLLGSYSVVVTDLKNCSASGNYLISQPATPLTINVSSLPVNCFGEANGSASVSISGGTPNYSISWSNGATTNSVADLSAGLYSVTVLDANLCSSTANIQVNQPNLLVVNADSTNVNCFGAATGSVNAIVSGGIAPYTYSWNNGANTVAVSNLISGIYGITITDLNGCIASDSTSINQPQAPLQISFSITNNICFGTSQGAIDAVVSGGTPPYNYLWSTSEISDFISSLPVGNYQLNITDALGCQLSQDTSVTQPNQIIATSQYTMVSCFNGVDGALDVSTSGGVFPYQYSWSNGANSEDITNLEAGNYTLTIEDSNLCQSNFTFTVTQPDTLVVSYNAIQPSCHGYSNGQLIANPTGGTSPYSYDWSNGDVTFTADSLSVGTYTVLVTDINGCQAQIDCILNEPPQLQVSFDADSLEGCSPFTVNFQNTSDPSVSCFWNFGDGQTYDGCENVTNTFLDGGTYNVYLAIIDANGCTNNVTYNDFITVNHTPDAQFNVEPQQLFSFSNTTNITNQSTGGDFYIWNLGDESPSHLYFEPGEHSYPINVSDTFLITLIAQTIEGCFDTTTKIILFNNDPFYYVPNTFIPDDDGRNDVWKPVFSSIENVRRYSLQVFNRWGEIVFETNDPQTGWNGMIESNSKKAQDGTYSWKLQFSWFDYKIYPASGHVNLIR